MKSKIVSFFQSVRGELKKVSWPSRREIVRSTLVVVVTVLIFGLIIGVIDVIFLQILKIILR